MMRPDLSFLCSHMTEDTLLQDAALIKSHASGKEPSNSIMRFQFVSRDLCQFYVAGTDTSGRVSCHFFLMASFSLSHTVISFCKKGSSLKGNNLLPVGANSFLLE